MNIQTIKTVSKLKLHRGLLVTQKYSPEILTGVGIVGGVTAAVMGAKATLKLEPIVDELHENVEVAHAKLAAEDFDEKQHKKVVAFLHIRSGIDVTKLYGPSISLGLVSIGCIVGAHGIMQKRNVGLVAAFAASEKTFAEYRKRVEDAVGADLAEEIRFNAKKETVPVSEGSKETKEVLIPDPDVMSQYARFFDELSKNWSPEPEYNLAFLRCQQNYANDKLQAKGHIFLNEVYDMLDIPRSKAGAIVGWTISKDGDNYVDFGFMKTTEKVRDFVNGREPAIRLDFNVDGVIFDKIV